MSKFSGTLQPFVDTGNDVNAWFGHESNDKTNTVGGLEDGNTKAATIALLSSGGNLYLVMIYGTTANGGTAGGTSVTVTGADSLLLTDDNGEGSGYPGAMTFEWRTKETDGFIVSVSSGSTVCYEHAVVDRVENLRFLQNDATALSIAISTAEVETNDICVKVP